MTSVRSCVACTKTIYANDARLVSESGAYHRECAKCSECKGQLTNINYAEMSGVLFCKPHFISKFKLRGKYDDVLADSPGVSSPSPAVPASEDATPTAAPVPEETTPVAAEEVTQAPGEPSSSTSHLVHDETPKRRTSAAPPVHVSTPVPDAPAGGECETADSGAGTPAAEVFISGPSVRDRIKAQLAAAASTALPSSPVVAAPTAVTAAAVGRVSPAPHSGADATATSAGAHGTATNKSPAASNGTATMNVNTTLERGKSHGSNTSGNVTPKASPPALGAAATQSVTPTVSTPSPSAKAATSSALASRFGGGGVKCVKCTKTVYAAEPQLTVEDATYHKECFKCTNCLSQLSLTQLASIDSQPFCKPCYTRIFKLKGSYADLQQPTGAASPGLDVTKKATNEETTSDDTTGKEPLSATA